MILHVYVCAHSANCAKCKLNPHVEIKTAVGVSRLVCVLTNRTIRTKYTFAPATFVSYLSENPSPYLAHKKLMGYIIREQQQR